MLMSEAFLIVVRYVVAAAFANLVQYGWHAPGDEVVGAVAQIIVGVLGFLSMLAWGLYKSRFRAKVQSVLAARGVSTLHVDPETATGPLAGVDNVVPTPPAGA